MSPGYRRAALVLAGVMVAASGVGLAGQVETAPAPSKVEGKLKIFDGKAKIIVVNGYSTSFLWPYMLQRKLDRHFDGRRVITVRPATRAGAPIAKWMDAQTGKPKPAWRQVRTALKAGAKGAVRIALAQQSLQGSFGDRSAGIRGADDAERIAAGADVLARYARLLRADGAELVFIATHIYKQPMEPAIGNERLALAELVKRKPPGVAAGPDVWEPTRKLYPKAFGGDKVHPNSIGSEVMAQKWFECLLAHDGLAVPAWSRAEMAKAIASAPQSTRALLRQLRGAGRRRALPTGVQVHRDVEYAQVGDVKLLLDVYVPAEPAGPLPAVVWVHGGGWRGGDKRGCPAVNMTAGGYVIASINYRLSDVAIFPAQIQDCKAAIRHLRANADKYRIDPKRIGAWGPSAGGHLVALLGTSGGAAKLEGEGGNADQSSRVQAVCDWFGPTDLTKLTFPAGSPYRRHNPVTLLLGGPASEKRQLADMANPVRYVSKDDPPFLIMHGDRDAAVPISQSVLLHEALKKAGVETTLYVVKGGGHGFGGPAIGAMVAGFFDKHLKPRSPAGEKSK